MSDGTELTPIPKIYNCYSDTYANLVAASGAFKAGELAYSTDRLVLYRWSGVALVLMTFYTGSGLAAAIPTAADLPNGSWYYETDTQKVKQVQAGAWVTVVDPVTYLTSSSIGAYQKVVKTAEEIVNNSAVLQNDNELLIAVTASEVSLIIAMLRINIPSVNSDFRYLFTVPAGGTIKGFGLGLIGPLADPQDMVTEANLAGVQTSANVSSGGKNQVLYMLYEGGGNAGNIQYQWAQGTATAEDTKVLTRSCLVKLRLS